MELISLRNLMMQASVPKKLHAPTSRSYFSSGGRGSHGWASVDVNKIVCTPDDDSKKDEEKEEAWWVPHPKNGIFYPEGQQKWIEDVNNHRTAHEQKTYWLRSLEDVQKPPHHIDLNIYITSD